MNDAELILLFHGALVLVVGLLAGVPYGLSMRRGRPERIERAWRVAHSGLTMGGVLLISTSAVLALVAAESSVERIVAYALVASGYGFCVSLPYAAWGGHDSVFWPSRTAASWIISIGNIIGAGGSLLAAICLAYGVAVLL